MKIETKVGNLLNVKSGHIVHGCNAQGVMGSGVALAVKRTYPKAYEDYINIHKVNGLELGRSYPVMVSPSLTVWNAITQDNYGWGTRQISYDAIQTCFQEINDYIAEVTEDLQPKEIHIPLIGAARGGGNWTIIKTIIEETVQFPVTLWMPDASVDTI